MSAFSAMCLSARATENLSIIASRVCRIFGRRYVTIRKLDYVMELIDTNTLPSSEKLPGWHGSIFHAQNMTFAHWRFEADATIHEHFHEQEEVWHVLEGKLEAKARGETFVAGPGMVLILEPNLPHSIKALSDGRAIVADHPSRRDFG
jgi:quercetin dioxygenase-like cupin family protein